MATSKKSTAKPKRVRRPIVVFGIVFALLIGMIPLFSNSARGTSTTTVINPEDIRFDFPDAPTDAELAGKEVVYVGVYILSVGNLDTTTGTYSMDLFLNFKCQTPPCDPTTFDIMNAASQPDIEDQTDDEVRGSEFYYRIRAELQTNLNLRNFPFDEHILAIEFEDKNKLDTEFIYVPSRDLSGIDTEVYVAGWDIEPFIRGLEKSHAYAVYDDEAYSRARFAIRIYHPWFSSFMKGLFAAIVIVGVGMLSFLMQESEAADRLELTSATLAGAIFYHMTLTASIPPVGYLTYGDRFMILQYLFITASLGVAIALFLLQNEAEADEESQRLARQIHLNTRWTIPALWIVSMIALHLFTLNL